MAVGVSAASTAWWGGRPSRAVVLVERALLAVLVAYFVARGFVPGWQRLSTDFPNYYLAARLVLERVPFEHAYDWVWFQRQKDHAGIDWGTVSYGPITPFSAFVLTPVAHLSALAAKRVWLVVNLGLLGAIVALLHRRTGLGLRRVLVLVFLTVIPLRTSFDFGQQHLLVACLVAVAVAADARRRDGLAGVVIAVATLLKLYPALFLVVFIVRRRVRSIVSFLGTCLVGLALAVATLGVAPFRAYAREVMPRVSMGEVNDPYALGLSSPTVLLRTLFVREPSLNPAPLVDSVAAYCVLQPLVQATLATALFWLLIRRRCAAPYEGLLWGLVGSFALLLSTGSSTYHFCLLIVPTVLGVDACLRRGEPRLAATLVVLHTLVGLPLYRLVPDALHGGQVLLGAPRLYALFGYVCAYSAAYRRILEPAPDAAWQVPVAVGGSLAMTLSGALSTWRHLRGLDEAYAARLTADSQALVTASPAVAKGSVYASRLEEEGYALGAGASDRVRARRGEDVLAPTAAAASGEVFVEVAERQSYVARVASRSAELERLAENAESPSVSSDGKRLLFVREQAGRGELWLMERSAVGQSWGTPSLVAGGVYDVQAGAVSADGRVLFSSQAAWPPELYLVPSGGRADRDAKPLGASGRDPAFSPDGAWVAWSAFEGRAWQVEVANVATGERRAITHGDCNARSPAWSADGRRIVYATDCGRGVGASALAWGAALP